jgi:hypothetical protein
MTGLRPIDICLDYDFFPFSLILVIETDTNEIRGHSSVSSSLERREATRILITTSFFVIIIVKMIT